jgi:hypothetical protein
MLSGQSGNEFRCECPAGYFGPFCEYQDTSQTDDEAKSPEKAMRKSQPNLKKNIFLLDLSPVPAFLFFQSPHLGIGGSP